jgi:branched-chain amino acid transport system ATP-binding protein
MLLEVKNLKVSYGKAEVLRSINMQIDEAEIITLVGANGAGKSTFLRTLSGIVQPTSGEIWFQGDRIDRMPPYHIFNLGIAHIPEGRRVFATMSTLENLEFGAHLRKDKHEIRTDLDSIYTQFPILKERRQYPAGSLSGGQQQMLATARALMARPKLLLMDEPSLGLSPMLVKRVGDIIRDINKSGVTIILVEQNAHMALKLADRAYVLELGNIVLEGNARELLHDERVAKSYLGV